MIGVRGAGKVRLMARVAGSWCVCVVVVRMALHTRKRGVHTGKRVVGIRRVIEVDRCPV